MCFCGWNQKTFLLKQRFPSTFPCRYYQHQRQGKKFKILPSSSLEHPLLSWIRNKTRPLDLKYSRRNCPIAQQPAPKTEYFSQKRPLHNKRYKLVDNPSNNDSNIARAIKKRRWSSTRLIHHELPHYYSQLSHQMEILGLNRSYEKDFEQLRAVGSLLHRCYPQYW